MTNDKKSSKATWIILIVLILMGISFSINSQKQNSGSSPQAVNQTSKTWHTVEKVDSDADANTPAFSMQGSEWRITYGCNLENGASSDDTDFSASIASTEGPYGEMFAIGVKCPVSDVPSYYYSEKPGNYYLKLGSPDVHYTVSVEDYY